MRYYIITGTSRGLGEALARRFAAKGNVLFCISRRRNEGLVRLAESKGAGITYYERDLECLEGLEALAGDIFSRIDARLAETITLVNNAGTVEPVRPLERCEAGELRTALNVNLLAPMILSALFIRHSAGMRARRTIVNITSGAAVKPYFGWSAYCTSKAGIDMLTRVAGLEQSGVGNPVKIVAVAPGVVDTDMQRKIRETDEEDFRARRRFVDLKEKGELTPPDEAAAKIVELLDSGALEQGGIYDLRALG